MATKSAEIQRQLKKNNWILSKAGSKHDVYEKEGKTILIPRGTKMYSRSYKQILRKINGCTDRSREDASLRNLSGNIKSVVGIP